MYFVGDVAPFELLYISLIDFGIAAFTITIAMGGAGMRSVLGGNTPYEIRKNIRFEELDTMTIAEKFQQVFGSCGLLYFIFPFVPFDSPEVEPGYRRIITYGNEFYGSGTHKTNVI